MAHIQENRIARPADREAQEQATASDGLDRARHRFRLEPRSRSRLGSLLKVAVVILRVI